MRERLLDRDPVTGIQRTFHADADGENYVIETVQDVGDLIEDSKARYNDAPSDWKGDMHRVAQIPMSLFFDLKKKGIVDDPKRFRDWLNDRENRFFRTRPGRV